VEGTKTDVCVERKRENGALHAKLNKIQTCFRNTIYLSISHT